MKKYIALALAATVLVAGCKEDNDEAAAATTATTEQAAAEAPATGNEEKAELNNVITKVAESLKAGDIAATVEHLYPPKVLDTMAKGAGMNKETMMEMMRTQIAAVSDTMTYSEVEMGENIEWGETESGEMYGLVPSSTVFELNDPSTGASMKMKETSTFIAILDAGKWYLSDISKPEQQALFAEAYPAYANVTAPASTAEMVE